MGTDGASIHLELVGASEKVSRADRPLRASLARLAELLAMIRLTLVAII